MEAIQTFLNSMLATVGPFVPKAIAALLILIGAWLIAKVARTALTRVGQRAGLDARLRSPGIASTLGTVGYYLVWLMALPMLLQTVGLTSLLDPVNMLLGQFLGFLPRLFGAAVVLAIGLLVARVVRQIVTGVLTAAGSEKLAGRLGMRDALGKDGLAGLIGTVLFVMILLPVVAGALQPLGLDAVTKPVTSMLDTLTALLPKIFGAAVIIGISVVLGRVLADIVTRVAAGLGFNRVPGLLGMAANTLIAGRTPSELVGALVFLSMLLAALTSAGEVLGFAALTTGINTMGSILAQISGGAIVLGIGLWLSTLAGNALRGSTIGNAKTLATVARGAVLFFTIPMALRQMGLPAEIITLGFGSVMVGLALAAALAFGIGGRHAAGHWLNQVTGAPTDK